MSGTIPRGRSNQGFRFYIRVPPLRIPDSLRPGSGGQAPSLPYLLEEDDSGDGLLARGLIHSGISAKHR